ncbi:MAG: hypothetical protein MJ252_23435 [archaeon]|nr:hypothetical protein [archaeon]
MKSFYLLILLNLVLVFNHPITGNPTEQHPSHSHVFLVKTDLTKEQVEELLRKVENSNSEVQMSKKLNEEEPQQLMENSEQILVGEKAQKSEQKKEKAMEKVEASAEQREEKNQIAEEKIEEKENKAAEKEIKAENKAEVAEAKAAEKENKVKDKEANDVKKKESKKGEIEAAQTNLLKVNPGQRVEASSVVALFLILFVFVALILLGTQYENVKKHFKLDIKNEALTDYLLVDQKNEGNHNDYPSIRDF